MKSSYQPVDWIMLIGLSLMWGFSFFFIKKGLEAFEPVHVGALRIFIAFCTLAPFLLFYRKQVPFKAVLYICLAGMLGSGLPPFLFSFGQTHVSSSVTGILNTTTPLFVLTFGILLFGLKARLNQFLGVLLGLAGAVTIVLSRSDGNLSFDPRYACLIILATACYGMSANILKSKVMAYKIHPIQISVYGFCFIGPFAGVYLWHDGVFQRLLTDPVAQNASAYLLVLGIFGTALAMFVFNTLTMRTSALFASFTTYLIPVVAILVGLVVLGERLHWMHVAGFMVIISGVVLANLSARTSR